MCVVNCQAMLNQAVEPEPWMGGQMHERPYKTERLYGSTAYVVVSQNGWPQNTPELVRVNR